MAEETQVQEPIAAEPIAAEPTVAERVSKLEGESYDAWRTTGKLPEVETKTESESSTDAPEKVAEAKDSKEQERKPSRREARILELLNENKRLSDEIAKSKGGGKQEESKVAATDRAATKEEAAAATARPVLKDFPTYEDWVEALTDWKVEQRVSARFDEDRKARELSAKTSEVEKANKEIEHIWMERVNESMKLHDDYEKVAFNKDLPIKTGSVVDRWILESEHGPEVLYYLGSNPEELTRINALGNIGQSRELAKIEADFEKAPVKKITKAPPPPAQVNGNGTISADPVEEALKGGNFRRYMEEQNARELKNSRKG